MIPTKFAYAVPADLAEACALLAADSTNVALAGGNGLLTRLKRDEVHPATVVDLRRLDELRGITVTATGRLRSGALTTLTELMDDRRVRAAHGTGALGDAIAVAGDVQARNRATLGGTVASAAPGSDLSAALLVLEATVQLAGPAGSRVVPVADLLSEAVALGPGELIVAVEVAPAEPGSAYCRMADRATLHALCGVAVTVALGMDGSVNRCRIAVTGALAHPARLAGLEGAVLGTRPPVRVPPSDGRTFVEDSLASAEYRRQMTSTLAERAFFRAVARARNA